MLRRSRLWVVLLLLLLLLLRRRKPRRGAGDRGGGIRLGPLLPERMNPPRSVLFVCVGNSGRSLMAEAIFNADPPPGWVAISAGTQPAEGANPRVVEALAEIGLRPPPHPPQPLTPEMMDGAGVVVTMGCLDDASCPARLKHRPLRDWGLADPKGMDLAEIRGLRGEVLRRVAALRDELTTNPTTGLPIP